MVTLKVVEPDASRRLIFFIFEASQTLVDSPLSFLAFTVFQILYKHYTLHPCINKHVVNDSCFLVKGVIKIQSIRVSFYIRSNFIETLSFFFRIRFLK